MAEDEPIAEGEAQVVMRAEPLEGRAASAHGVSIAPAPPATRLSVRAPSRSRGPLSRSLSVRLPDRPGASASRGARHSLWLGPDEWLVLDEDEADLAAASARVAALHSAVDISHRNTAILLWGAGAEDILAAGCPRDLALAAFPVGECARTVFGKVEIVLWRTGEDAFRIEVWRSFADYAFTLLETAACDLA